MMVTPHTTRPAWHGEVGETVGILRREREFPVSGADGPAALADWALASALRADGYVDAALFSHVTRRRGILGRRREIGEQFRARRPSLRAMRADEAPDERRRRPPVLEALEAAGHDERRMIHEVIPVYKAGEQPWCERAGGRVVTFEQSEMRVHGQDARTLHAVSFISRCDGDGEMGARQCCIALLERAGHQIG